MARPFVAFEVRKPNHIVLRVPPIWLAGLREPVLIVDARYSGEYKGSQT